MEKYELCCRTVHCRGEILKVAGIVSSRKEAEDWLRERQGAGKRGSAPGCRASVCPLKQQRPVYFYRKAGGPDETV